jgi:hypothetical protein
MLRLQCHRATLLCFRNIRLPNGLKALILHELIQLAGTPTTGAAGCH